jgi:hypothetical protein
LGIFLPLGKENNHYDRNNYLNKSFTDFSKRLRGRLTLES